MSSEAKPQDPITAFLVAQRSLVGALLVALAVVSFGVGIKFVWNIIESRRAVDVSKDTITLKEGESKEALKNLASGSTWSTTDALGLLAAFTLAGVSGAIGVTTLASLPKLTPEARESDARRMLILSGGAIGLTLMVFSLAFFLNWYSFLRTWLDSQGKGTPTEAAKVIGTLIVFLLGGGLAFFCAQPARAEERSNPFLRRLIFGVNLGLSTFLLLLFLVVVNILVTIKVPNRLDTTATGVNTVTLSEETKDFISKLEKPVMIYHTMDMPLVSDDANRMLEACREANTKNFAYKYLSESQNFKELQALTQKYPAALGFASQTGMFVVVGTNEPQTSFIPFAELTKSTPPSAATPDPVVSFVGEGRLMKELLFLADNKSKSVIYALTGHGEIEVIPDPTATTMLAKNRTGNRLRAKLENTNVELRPLKLDPLVPRIPEDASILLIADPTMPYTPAEAESIRNYLKNPGPKGRVGKLLLFAGANPSPDKQVMVNIGLDGVLGEYGIVLGDRFLLNDPRSGAPVMDAIGDLIRIRGDENPLTDEVENIGGQFVLPNAREVMLPQGTKSQTTKPLFVTTRDRITWLENEYPTNPMKAFEQTFSSNEVLNSKQPERGRSRVLAALVSQENKGQIAVIGSGRAFADPARGESYGIDRNTTLAIALNNWLRDQPAVANVAAKEYGFYRPKNPVDFFRGSIYPVFLGIVGTITFGLGIWMVRRK
ncbi:MAG: Gldg family protein [Fimbriiglobus sp.]